LEDNTPLRYSLMHPGNETARLLSSNSETENNENTSQWWKYLSLDNESNIASSNENRGIIYNNFVM